MRVFSTSRMTKMMVAMFLSACLQLPQVSAQSQTFSVQGSAIADWNGEIERGTFGEVYNSQPSWSLQTSAMIGGEIEAVSASSRYRLELFGSSFGVSNEIRRRPLPFPSQRDFSSSASSLASAWYRVPSLANHPELEGRITSLVAYIPIHGEVGLYDGGNGGPGALVQEVAWSFVFDEGTNMGSIGASGLLTFESQFGAAPTVTRSGELADPLNLNLVPFNEGFNPILGDSSLMGYEVDGFSTIDFNVDLVEGDTFSILFALRSTLNSSQDFVYGNADFFNSSAFEIFAVDSNGKIVSDFAFAPVGVPEPASAALCLTGLVAVSLVRARKLLRGS